MHLNKVLLALVLFATEASAGRSLRHVGKTVSKTGRDKSSPFGARNFEHFGYNEHSRRSTNATPIFLNYNTTKFSVNGTGIPDVDFDIGESYAGLLPITSDPDDKNKLYFWFFPSTNSAAEKEITIWLNGGPGCSSLEGLLQENGPFLWQYGTYKPYPNPWSWNKLTNMVYIEQPLGTGFSQGDATATNEEDVATQFMGFWRNFVDTFGLQGYKVYVTGESYAGMYCSYIASGMLDANDTTYFNVSGMLIYDPEITDDAIQDYAVAYPFVDYWRGLFPFNNSLLSDLAQRHQTCGYADYLDKYLVYPPNGSLPSQLPGTDKDGNGILECEDIYNDATSAATALNPCFDIYQVATTCPLLWDVLGFPGSLTYSPDGSTIYFDRPDVKKAINAPNITWEECSSNDVFVGGTDTSPGSSIAAIPNVIDRTKNVIIGHGALDMVLIANGTLLAIQNMTWGGKLGFQSPPVEPFYVPYHDDPSLATIAGSGVMGTAHTERGLTYVGVALSGHMIPQYAPSAAYRHLEFLLGRVGSLSSVEPFTTDGNVTQVDASQLGNGTAPQGWSAGANTSSSSTGAGAGKSAAVQVSSSPVGAVMWLMVALVILMA